MNGRWKILCVDDEKLFLSSVRRFFVDYDCELFLAESTAEAWNILDRHAPIHLVLSDYRMPVENGMDFLLRVARHWPETVRFIVSGYADVATINLAMKNKRIDYFVQKPWVSRELKAALQEAITLFESRSEKGR